MQVARPNGYHCGRHDLEVAVSPVPAHSLRPYLLDLGCVFQRLQRNSHKSAQSDTRRCSGDCSSRTRALTRCHCPMGPTGSWTPGTRRSNVISTSTKVSQPKGCAHKATGSRREAAAQNTRDWYQECSRTRADLPHNSPSDPRA